MKFTPAELNALRYVINSALTHPPLELHDGEWKEPIDKEYKRQKQALRAIWRKLENGRGTAAQP